MKEEVTGKHCSGLFTSLTAVRSFRMGCLCLGWCRGGPTGLAVILSYCKGREVTRSWSKRHPSFIEIMRLVKCKRSNVRFDSSYGRPKWLRLILTGSKMGCPSWANSQLQLTGCFAILCLPTTYSIERAILFFSR